MRKTVLLLASMAAALMLASGVAIVEAVRPAQAAFPGTNGKIVFVRGGMELINPKGSGLTTLIDIGVFYSPAMSPDGKKVAYARGYGNESEIFKINVNTRKITRITNNEMYDGDPAWSPDGARISFERGTSTPSVYVADTDIFVKSSDGTGPEANLTNTPNEDEFAPAWSPNGEEIAFQIGPYLTATDVFVLNLNTGQRRNLTNDGTARQDRNPSWSPDGNKIVFESFGYDENGPGDDDGFDRIYTINASDGSDRRLLAEVWRDFPDDEGLYLHSSTYSPNGNQIAYVRIYDWDTGFYGTILKMNASDGSNKQVIYWSRWLHALDWGKKVSP